MEYVSCRHNVMNGALHMGAYNHRDGNPREATYGRANTVGGEWGSHSHTLNASFTVEDFHVYTAEVTPEKLTFAVDGQTYFEYVNDRTCNTQTWPFAQRFNFILNIAIGGGFGGYCLNGQAPSFGGSDREMEVDWVRVSQKRDGYQDSCSYAPPATPTSCEEARSVLPPPATYDRGLSRARLKAEEDTFSTKPEYTEAL